MLNKLLPAALVLSITGLGMIGNVRADGVVQKASKDAAKGAIKGVQQELNTGELVQGAKEVTKGMVDGISNAVPMMTSQILKQTDVNKKAIGHVARQVSTQAVSGALGAAVHEMDESLGRKGDGPLAEAIAATSERVTAAAVRGIG